MSNLKLALLVSARRELHLTAGEVALDKIGQPEFEHIEEKITTLDGPEYMKVGLAQLGSVYVHGAEVVNVKYPSDSIMLSWYLPDEEEPSAARPINLTYIGLIPKDFPRQIPEKGHVWRFRVEGRSPFVETLIYQIGFQPPFKPSDLTVHLTDLSSYGFNSFVISQILYCHRAPSYTEGDFALTEVISEGLLDS
jgi:hypothetical protein